VRGFLDSVIFASMLFNSWEFLVFLPIVVCCYYTLPQRYRWLLLLVASCVFYMYFIPQYILILFALILIDYTAAIFIDKVDGRNRKLLLIASLAANLSLLFYFKYADFLGETLQTVFAFMGLNIHVPKVDVVLPIGLSFHTFQSMAYTIEVYNRRQVPEKHLGIYSVYVLFFPQMVAGPIERFKTLGNQLKQYHGFRMENIVNGLRMILFGLFIKMVVADQLSPLVDLVYKHPSSYTSLSVAGAIVLFSFQIYADFWGYSTIAIGSACMMGIVLMDNFRAPYLSSGISMFWSKWHISLSTWFKDYVYIPLGGNRTTVARWCINILIVFGLSGLWHGASWTFLVWGLIHALMYLLERGIKSIFKQQNGILSKIVGWAFTFSGVSLAWVFFRSGSFAQATEVIRQLFKEGTVSLVYTWQVVVACVLFMSADLIMRGERFDTFIQQKALGWRWLAYAVLIFGICIMAAGEDQPFIYFQF
jgi:alginate O-acetyltransferase complex protein AlgI